MDEKRTTSFGWVNRNTQVLLLDAPFINNLLRCFNIQQKVVAELAKEKSESKAQ